MALNRLSTMEILRLDPLELAQYVQRSDFSVRGFKNAVTLLTQNPFLGDIHVLWYCLGTLERSSGMIKHSSGMDRFFFLFYHSSYVPHTLLRNGVL